MSCRLCLVLAGNSTYLTSAKAYKARSLEEESDSARNYNVFNYQNSLPGVNLLLAQATGFATNEYTLATKGFMIVWMSGKYTIRYVADCCDYYANVLRPPQCIRQ